MSWLELLTWNNRRIGLRFALDCLTPSEKALELGLMDLQEDIQKVEPYNHDQIKAGEEYGKKNEYFNRTNAIGMPFLQKGITGISKMFYWRMLNAINEYEKNQRKPLNKGMVCGNLCVSALAEGDLDGGIAYLLWAVHEDRKWSGDPTENILTTDLYTQFSTGNNRQGRSQFGKPAPWTMFETAIQEYNAEFSDKLRLRVEISTATFSNMFLYKTKRLEPSCLQFR